MRPIGLCTLRKRKAVAEIALIILSNFIRKKTHGGHAREIFFICGIENKIGIPVGLYRIV